MFRWIQRWFWLLARWALRLRYRVRLEGLRELRELRGSTLVMPNHPGYVDPLLLLSHLRMNEGIRPVVFSGMFRKPLPLDDLDDAAAGDDRYLFGALHHGKPMGSMANLGILSLFGIVVFPDGQLVADAHHRLNTVVPGNGEA